MDAAKKEIIRIGQALLALNLQSTHSGNISLRQGGKIFITRSGTMKGHLEEKDILALDFDTPIEIVSDVSTEALTHKGILNHSHAVIHAHSSFSTLLAFQDKFIRPKDYLGKIYLNSIPVKSFRKPVGSGEMAQCIPRILSDHVAMVVKSHGPFVRGKTLAEAMMFLCILEYSAQILFYLRMLGLDSQGWGRDFSPGINHGEKPILVQAIPDPETLNQCLRITSDLFKMGLSPFYTGSLSFQNQDKIFYVPHASMPASFKPDFYLLDDPDTAKDFFLRLHGAVHAHSTARAAIFFHSPFAMIQSICVRVRNGDAIIPIDAEGRFLYPAIPLVSWDEEPEKIISRAEKNKIVVFPGFGAFSLGSTLEDAIHHCSSLKNICWLKIGQDLLMS